MRSGRLSLVALGLAVFLIGASGRQTPPVVEAAKKADSDGLRALVQQGADVAAADGDGTTALHWASYHDDLEMAQLLIHAGANPSAATDLGVTPLWNACLNGSAALVGRLLQAGANASATLLLGESLVMAAARSGNPDVVRQLVAAGAEVNASAARGQTALMWAVANRHAQVVEVLLAHGADVHARSHVWTQLMGVPPHSVRANQREIPQGGYTALLFAARVGDLASARLLVAAGADVNDADAWGISATALAAHSGFAALVEFLLDQGADPNADTAGFTALHAAIMRRDEAMVEALLAHGADPNAPLLTWTPTRRGSDDFHFDPAWVGATPLWLAARFSPPAVLRRLVEHGADPLVVHRSTYYRGGDDAGDAPQTEVTTALMAALGMGGGGPGWAEPDPAEREALTLEGVKFLVQLGVDVDAANTDGRTALQTARRLGYASVVAYLLEKGASETRPARPAA